MRSSFLFTMVEANARFVSRLHLLRLRGGCVSQTPGVIKYEITLERDDHSFLHSFYLCHSCARRFCARRFCALTYLEFDVSQAWLGGDRLETAE